MARAELTDSIVKGYLAKRREDLVDTREPGLALRVTPAGGKTWVVRLRSADGTAQRVKIGSYPDMSLRAARAAAATQRVEIRSSTGNLNKTRRAEADAASASPTLADLLTEYGAGPGRNLATWQPSARGGKSEAVLRIRAVFARMLERRVGEISVEDLAAAMQGYVPRSGKASANGQVSRGRAYLMSVLDWAAGRGRFSKVGKRRHPTVPAPDMHETHDPATDDPLIAGERDRTLDHVELAKVLPLLSYPAPTCLGMGTPPEMDLRPLAMKFILLTAARLDEVVTMLWRDVDFENGVWTKPHVKRPRGGPRKQQLPLSDAALSLLRSLPNFSHRQPKQLCFSLPKGTEIGNWNRITTAVHRESNTSDWHRHDLRRTSSTVLDLIGVAPRVIDRILAHKTDNKKEGTSKALEHYIRGKNILRTVDPQKAALDQLAEVYAEIEADREKANQAEE